MGERARWLTTRPPVGAASSESKRMDQPASNLAFGEGLIGGHRRGFRTRGLFDA
jgi:hypothetical protein